MLTRSFILFLNPLYLDRKVYICYLQDVLRIQPFFPIRTATPLRAGFHQLSSELINCSMKTDKLGVWGLAYTHYYV